MSSTGNDIVSLDAINIPRTLQPGFYSKILCAAEIAVYKEAGLTQIPFERYVWLLWSVKESAYKYLQRHNPALVFSPTKFVVTLLQIPEACSLQNEGVGFESEQAYNGKITFGSETLHSRSLMNDDFIFSVVNGDDDFENICWGIKSIDNSGHNFQSTEARNVLLRKLDDFLPYDNVSITKTPHGCPVLMNDDQRLDIPISLAHHDHWVAYSCLLKEIPFVVSF